jgi:hypothetical protein
MRALPTEELDTRELSVEELEDQLAEQLPARELMGGCCRSCGCGPSISVSVHLAVGVCL